MGCTVFLILPARKLQFTSCKYWTIALQTFLYLPGFFSTSMLPILRQSRDVCRWNSTLQQDSDCNTFRHLWHTASQLIKSGPSKCSKMLSRTSSTRMSPLDTFIFVENNWLTENLTTRWRRCVLLRHVADRTNKIGCHTFKFIQNCSCLNPSPFFRNWTKICISKSQSRRPLKRRPAGHFFLKKLKYCYFVPLNASYWRKRN